jgi:hypothetical protein
MPDKTSPSSFSCTLAAAALCAGCSPAAPSVAILGAFFPGWMLCALLGIALALALRAAVAVARRGRPLEAPPLLYPALALLCGVLAWILLFQGGA